jgi:hypothetical protein
VTSLNMAKTRPAVGVMMAQNGTVRVVEAETTTANVAHRAAEAAVQARVKTSKEVQIISGLISTPIFLMAVSKVSYAETLFAAGCC